jgi:hypothetical protein
MFLVNLYGSEYFLKVSVYVSILLTSKKTLSDRGRAPFGFCSNRAVFSRRKVIYDRKLRPHVAFGDEMMLIRRPWMIGFFY